MGSLEEFKEAVSFTSKHKIIPTVHQIYDSLDNADQALNDLKEGNQFGKLVVSIASGAAGGQTASRL